MIAIVVEGSDGGGKSTLVNELHKQTGLTIYKESLSYADRQSETYNGFDHYVLEILKVAAQNKPRGVIIDRFFSGEFVLPIVHRAKDKRSPLTLQEIGKLATLMNEQFSSVVYITCVPSEEFAKNVFDTRGEDVAKIEDVKYLNAMYKSVGFYLSQFGVSIEYHPQDYIDDVSLAVHEILITADLHSVIQKRHNRIVSYDPEFV